MPLTGRVDFRKTITGKIILRVEEEVKPLWPGSETLKKRWRDATVLDLTAPEMRMVMDARFRPNLLARTVGGATTSPS